MSYKLGIDIGSVSAKVIIFDREGEIKERYYCRTHGQPIETLVFILKDIFSDYQSETFGIVSATGSGGKLVSEITGVPFVNEITAQSTGTGRDYSAVRSIIEIGGEDAKLIHLENGQSLRIIDFSTSTVCAAGTGSFLDQQSSRMGIPIEDFGKVALKSIQPPRVAGRCSVFAKTDMIHLQQIGTPVEDIAAGLCYALARNFHSNVIKGSHLNTPIAFQGGVAANEGMIRAFRDILKLEENDLIIPSDFALRGAIGAVYASRAPSPENKEHHTLRSMLNALENYLKIRTINIRTLEPLENDNYSIITSPCRESYKDRGKIEGYLGVDVGSISTNVVVIDKNNNVLSRRYLLTAGRPIEAVRQGLWEVGKEIGDYVEIKAAGSTGSGRYMTGAFFGADVIKNEITSHAEGALAIDQMVDTIFEIGGQDAKYISLSNGTIVDFTMNKVCAAGTGSFLEEQAEKLAVKLDQEFGTRALASCAPLDLGERCTVFMESQLNYYKQQGMPKDDLLAGLAYSIATNYLNRVVEKHKIGNRIFFQGGVAFNRAVKSAFEKILNKKVIVPPQHDILGAIGVAIIAKEEQAGKQTAFKGFDLTKRIYQSSSFECKSCPNNCEIRRVVFERDAPLFYGSRCGKYDDVEIKKAREANPIPRLFKEREEHLIASCVMRNASDAPDAPRPTPDTQRRVGIPRTAIFFDLAPLWITFFQELGLTVVLSDPTNRTIIKQGVENVLSEPCFPIKTAHGHILNLLDKKIDYLFLPVQVNMPPLTKSFSRSYNCPYVQALPFTVESSIPLNKYPVKVLKPVFHMDRGEKTVAKTLAKVAKEVGIKDKEKINQAIQTAFQKQSEFNEWTISRGQEVLANLKPNAKAVVLIGRPYNTADSGLTLDLPERLRELGIMAIPIDFLPFERVMGEIVHDYPYMYWKSGQRILAAARLIARDKRLFAIDLTNFGCGPDSYIIKFFEKEMFGKPFLTLEIDEHSSDVGVMTRCEAFLDTIRGSKTMAQTQVIKIPEFIHAKKDGRTIYIPYMDDHGYVLAAAMRAQDISAEALPASDDKSLFLGRKFTSGKECFPSIITTGDIVKKVLEDGFNPEQSAFFMPAAHGPCRFGQYNKLHRMVLDSLDYHDVPIMLFDQSEGYHKDIAALGKSKFKRFAWRGIVLIDLMQKLARQIRPYEINSGETDQLYQTVLNELIQLEEKQGDIEQFARVVKERFQKIKINHEIKKPKIGVIGEIYVRSNSFANDFTVAKLEELDAEVALPPLEEWIDYIDYCRKENYLIARDYPGWRDYLTQKVTEFVQEYDANKIRKVFKGMIKDFYLEDPMEKVIECGRCYINPAVRGEAILSMARAVEYAEKGFSGIINIIPFGCMPGTIVSTLLKQFRDKHLNIPTYTIVVDGIKDPGSEMRLEAFVQQCRLSAHATAKLYGDAHSAK